MSSTLKIGSGWDEFCCDLELQVDGTRSLLTMSLEFSRAFKLIQQEQSSHITLRITVQRPHNWYRFAQHLGQWRPTKRNTRTLHLTRTNHLYVSINYGMPFFVWELQELAAIDLTLAHCHNWASSSSRRQSSS